MILAVTVFSTVLIALAAAVVGGVVSIFVYRNNKSKISPFADKVDNAWDSVELQKKVGTLKDTITTLETKIDAILNKL